MTFMLIRTQNICFIVLMIISRLIVTRGENLRKVKGSVGMQKLEEKSKQFLGKKNSSWY